MRRKARIARHVRLAFALERSLFLDTRRFLARCSKLAAAQVASGHSHLAANVVEHESLAFETAFKARLFNAADASAQLVIEELTGTKSDGLELETKFVSTIAIARDAIRYWLGGYAAEKVRKIADTTRSIIRRSVNRGNALNEPPRVLAKRVTAETGGEIAKARALTIARTETHIAANVGSNAAAEATGLDLNKEWGATEDIRTRPDHRLADGQTVDQNGVFSVGGFSMDFPGDPNGPAKEVINCRCVLLWIPRIPTVAPKVSAAEEEFKLPAFGKDRPKNIAMAKQFLEKFGVDVVEYRKADSSAAAMASGGKIHINKSHFFWKDPEAVASHNFKTGHLSSDKGSATLFHELGHLIFDSPDNFRSLSDQDLARSEVSKYAARNPHEFVSEMYAAKKMGRVFSEQAENMFLRYARPRVLPDKIASLFRYGEDAKKSFSRREFTDEGMFLPMEETGN